MVGTNISNAGQTNEYCTWMCARTRVAYGLGWTVVKSNNSTFSFSSRGVCVSGSIAFSVLFVKIKIIII